MSTAFGKLVSWPRSNELYPSIVPNVTATNHPDMNELHLPLNQTMLAEVLQAVGYSTYYLGKPPNECVLTGDNCINLHVGKWHLGGKPEYSPIARGYNESLAFLGGASLYASLQDTSIVNATYDDSFDETLWNILPFALSHNNAPPFHPPEYMTDYLSHEAARVIHMKAQIRDPNPFFVTVAYNAVHNPMQCKQVDYDHPSVRNIPGHNDRVHAAMVKSLDDGVGAIIEALTLSQQLGNTLLIFTSDNGGASGFTENVNKPYRGWKATFFEGSKIDLFFLVFEWCVNRRTACASVHADIYHTVIGAVTHLHNREMDTKALLGTLHNYSVSDTIGVNLLPFVNRVESSNINNGSAQVYVESVADVSIVVNVPNSRPFFWRAGHYSCLLQNNFKLQISTRPDKIWYFDLDADPTEQLNIAHSLLNITTRADWDHVNASIDPRKDRSNNSESGNIASTRKQFVDMMQLIEQISSTYITPSLWQSVLLWVQAIDKVDHGHSLNITDEYVYWPL